MRAIRSLTVTVALWAAVAAFSAKGSGFALYEPSAVSHALGGTLVGKAADASANYNNPATLTDLDRTQFTVGFVTEHPRGNAMVDGQSETMDPGLFWLPHFQFGTPLPFGFAFGLGISAEYGLGTCYRDYWGLDWSSQETTVQGLVLNPNLAYKITDDWSVGAGIRWLYFDFEQYSAPMATLNGVRYGSVDNRLKGDNRFRDLGWQIGTKYDILKNLSVGLVYKSAIDVDVDGKTSTSVRSYDYSSIPGYLPPAYQRAYRAQIRNQVDSGAAAANGAASAGLTLPQSVTGGVNWDITDRWHAGASVSWTEWSTFDYIDFHLPNKVNRVRLDWRDTWRASVGAAWDFIDDWRLMASYTYDMDSTTSSQQSTMLPPADRHILACGLAWNCWAGLELAVSYSCIFMAGGDMTIRDELGRSHYFETEWGFCHAGGFSVTYRF